MRKPEIPNFYIYKPHPDKKGYLTFDRMMTYGELDKALTAYLKSFKMKYGNDTHSAYDWLDYLSIGSLKKDTDPIPKERRIVSYVVKGASEGYYFHIESIFYAGSNIDIGLGKTLIEDLDFALRLQKHFAKFIIRANY